MNIDPPQGTRRLVRNSPSESTGRGEASVGNWIGREGKGGQAWLTYHLSGNEWVQLAVRNHKVAKDFVPGGTTLNDFNVEVVKRIKKDLEIKGNLTIEHWKAPVYLAGQHAVTAATVQLTWFPSRKVSF